MFHEILDLLKRYVYAHCMYNLDKNVVSTRKDNFTICVFIQTSLIRYCRDICQGMTFLHNNNVLHKDLAARNILIDGRTAKIADLGLSSFLTTDNDEVYTVSQKVHITYTLIIFESQNN